MKLFCQFAGSDEAGGLNYACTALYRRTLNVCENFVNIGQFAQFHVHINNLYRSLTPELRGNVEGPIEALVSVAENVMQAHDFWTHFRNFSEAQKHFSFAQGLAPSIDFNLGKTRLKAFGDACTKLLVMGPADREAREAAVREVFEGVPQDRAQEFEIYVSTVNLPMLA